MQRPRDQTGKVSGGLLLILFVLLSEPEEEMPPPGKCGLRHLHSRFLRRLSGRGSALESKSIGLKFAWEESYSSGFCSDGTKTSEPCFAAGKTVCLKMQVNRYIHAAS